MRSPITYYGGKSRISSKIVGLLRRHLCYVEPFCGGASIYFTKPQINWTYYSEVLNDTNGDIINFFRVLQDRKKKSKLIHKLKYTPYSKDEYYLCMEACDDDVERARRFFVNANMSFAGKLRGGWGYSIERNTALTFRNKVKALNQISKRLSSTYLENVDYAECIKRRDSPVTLFYCDPPYPHTCQGHYNGFGVDDFVELINCLEKIKGHAIVSSYHLDEIKCPKGWHEFKIETYCSAIKNDVRSKRTELIWVKPSTTKAGRVLLERLKSPHLNVFGGHENLFSNYPKEL